MILWRIPDGLSTLVLGQQTLAQVVVGIGEVELGLELEVSPPVAELGLVQRVEAVRRRGEHLARLVRQRRDQPRVVLQLDGAGDGHLLGLGGALQHGHKVNRLRQI